MSKDPALLFYTSDFLTGTMLMSHEQVGIYIRILCLMHQNKGSIDQPAFDSFVGQNDCIKSKFRYAEGKVFNDRLLDEMERRQSFCESRKKNRSHGKQWDTSGTYVATSVRHMETETIAEAEAVTDTVAGTEKAFELRWQKYPKKDGRKDALRHWKASIKRQDDLQAFDLALANYLASERVFNGYIKNGATFFNGWRDWVNYKEEVCVRCFGKGKYVSSTGYESICSCPRGNTARMGKT